MYQVALYLMLCIPVNGDITCNEDRQDLVLWKTYEYEKKQTCAEAAYETNSYVVENKLFYVYEGNGEFFVPMAICEKAVGI